MNEPWKPEIHITSSLARALLNEQFPRLAPFRVTPLGTGWDNRAFLVNDTHVFRFPQRQVAVPLLEREIRLMPRLAPQLPIPVPVPVFLGKPGHGYPWPFFGYVKIEGRTACEYGLSLDARADLAQPLAAFLAALHRSSPLAVEAALPGDDFGKAQWPSVRERTLAGLDALSDNLDPSLFKAVREIAAQPFAESIRGDVLVHGDLYVRHLMLDSDHRLTGVIDWGDSHLGDPAVDLSLAWSFLPKSAHALFRQTYGDISHETWRMARLRALFYGAVLARYGQETGQTDLTRESQFILANVTA